MDKKTGTIVNNESAEIIRMFNSAFNDLTGSRSDYYPADLRSEIDRINDRVYDGVNNGVYRAGFATTQQAYEEAVTEVFDTLDWVDDLLGTRRYLAGDRLTEADWRLFTTLSGSMPSMSGTSNAISAASPTTRTCRISFATSTRHRVLTRRSTWRPSSSTITARTAPSIRTGSYRPDRISTSMPLTTGTGSRPPDVPAADV